MFVKIKLKGFLFTLFSIALVNSASADSDAQHFPAIESKSLVEAKCNLSAYQTKLSAILEKSEITPLDAVKVHELTYTLENALIKMQQDLAQMAVVLEEVHLASEKLDTDVIKKQGDVFLSSTNELLNSQKCDVE